MAEVCQPHRGCHVLQDAQVSRLGGTRPERRRAEVWMQQYSRLGARGGRAAGRYDREREKYAIRYDTMLYDTMYTYTVLAVNSEKVRFRERVGGLSRPRQV